MISFLRSQLTIAALILIMVLTATASWAQSRNDEIDALRQELKRNREQTEALEQRINELELEKDKQAVIKDSDKDAWYKKIQVEYKKPGDGVTIKTSDENFSLRTRLLSQFQFNVTDLEEGDVASNFRVRRIRLIWDGNVYRPWFLYNIQVDALDDIILRDAHFDIAYNKAFAPRIGQFKVPFNREELTSDNDLQYIERSLVNEEFGFERDRGLAVYGVLGNYITYGAGVFNGDGRNGTSADSNLLYAARVQFTPCCGKLAYRPAAFPTGGDYNMDSTFGGEKPLLAIAGAVAYIPGLDVSVKTPEGGIVNRFNDIGATEGDVTQFTADVNFRYSRFSLEGDYIYRTIDPDGGFEKATDQGFRAQGGVFILPKFIEAAGRLAYVTYDDDISGRDNRYEITPGLNIYLSKSHKWALQFNYSMIKDEDTDGVKADTNVFRTQLQASF